MDLRAYQNPSNEYAHLSVKDLLDARDQYHIHLMRHPNVVATAIGLYRIRVEDDWPTKTATKTRSGKGVRTLANSEVRPYSWPCVLVFVSEWVEPGEFGKTGSYDPDALVPRTLYLKDGRRIPVCVVLAPRELATGEAPEIPETRFPSNNIGGGFPIIARVQGIEHIATIACLVSDGHKAYALTNRHVAGDAGEELFSKLAGKRMAIGTSSAKQCDRLLFQDVYDGWVGSKTYVNLDAGLVEIADLNQWSAKIRQDGETTRVMGPLADFSSETLNLQVIGARVRGYGSASGAMEAEVAALFYRYKSQNGFEFVADLLLGPVPERHAKDDKKSKRGQNRTFVTRQGDSGTLWLLEPLEQHNEGSAKQRAQEKEDNPAPPLPLAMQWGAHLLESPGADGQHGPQTYALATLLSTICRQLKVDPIRDWNLDQPDTWGAVGHFAIAAKTQIALSTDFPKLVELMANGASLIAPDDEEIGTSDFKGMGSAAFVHLADVPDFFWKHGTQGFSRHFEGPQHFADMDQPSDAFAGKTLLELCTDTTFIDPAKWDAFYDSVKDTLSGDPIAQEHRGLLPFRVWQIFEAMVQFARDGDNLSFVCAAGTLTHYLGDACQPLHISYLHDGDPDPARAVTRTVNHRDGTSSDRTDPLGVGVHSAYEDAMVNSHRDKILAGLRRTPVVKPAERIQNGFDAAVLTVKLMQHTFERLAPRDIVEAFIAFTGKPAERAAAFWDQFGDATIECMKDGAHTIAILWESAWSVGDGETNVKSTAAPSEEKAMSICADRDGFIPSLSISQIGAILHR